MPDSTDRSARTVGLKIDVDTLRGTLLGVPALMSSLKKFGAGATFYFSVGPDHTGRAIRRVFRPGFAKKVVRTSVLKHYGLKTLLYGVVLPGPHIGHRAGAQMRAAADAGFDVGVHTFDHVRWQDHVAAADARWTRREFERAVEAFENVFGFLPRSHAAAGWQMNVHVLELEREFDLSFASDCRGRGPFFPLLAHGASPCMQLPTTLPTFDELLGRDGTEAGNIADAVFSAWQRTAAGADAVFTLHAELEGMLLRAPFEALLEQWANAGVELKPLAAIHARLNPADIRSAPVEMREIPGRAGLLACQGDANE
jgi:undecaprenyl phosphate-alpha-L-ara4FN deformylase